MGNTGAIWIPSDPPLISSLSCHLKKSYCNARKGEWLYVHKTLESHPTDLGEKKH